MLIRLQGSQLPGRECGPGPGYPDGHHNIHVAVQGRKGQHDLVGLAPGDAKTVAFELHCDVVTPPPHPDLRGPQIHGAPGKRFVYITWGVVDAAGAFTMFRRAKLMLDAVPDNVMTTAIERGVLVGRLGLSDDHGRPLCAAVRPPRIQWSARKARGGS